MASWKISWKKLRIDEKKRKKSWQKFVRKNIEKKLWKSWEKVEKLKKKSCKKVEKKVEQKLKKNEKSWKKLEKNWGKLKLVVKILNKKSSPKLNPALWLKLFFWARLIFTMAASWRILSVGVKTEERRAAMHKIVLDFKDDCRTTCSAANPFPARKDTCVQSWK